LAGVGEGGPALPGAVHPDAEVEAVGRLPGERLAGLGVQPVGDGGGQGPGKDGQPGALAASTAARVAAW